MPTLSSQPNPNFDFTEPAKRSPPVPSAFQAPPPGAVIKFQPPPATPIYPQPINRPPTPAPAPPPTPRSGFRTGGRIAGSFKMPPGAGVAARTSAGFLGRRIPYLALAFFAYDAYQFACSIGLMPGSACPRPDNPNPASEAPPYKGGQCLGATYLVTVSGVDNLGRSFTAEPYVTYGRVFSTLNNYTEPNAQGEILWNFIVYSYNFSGQPFGDVRTSLYYTPGRDVKPYAFISKLERIDGGQDNCGDLRPKIAPGVMPDTINNISNYRRDININITIPKPRPPSPQPKLAPRRTSPPSPYPDININFGDNYFGGGDTDYDFDIDINFSPAPGANFNDYPDTFNNFPPSPQPQTREPDPVPKNNPTPQPAPQPQPLPESPPPLPDKLPENSTEQDKYIYRQNKETLDKVYKANAEILEIQTEQLKQRKILENIQSLLDFEVEGKQIIKRCDDIEVFYSYKEKVLRAINRQLDHVKMIEQTIINEVCSIEVDAVAAIPEWWERRLQSDIPQIALVFRSVGTKTYHKLTIPHPINTTKLINPPIISYQKGNFQAQIICIDNSKFIVNCLTIEESVRVANIALSLIDVVYKGTDPKIWLAERRGEPVTPGIMKGTSAMYFPTGQKNTKPEWRTAFK